MDIESRAVASHCAEVERCNQRGGRMLSIVDLIREGTISLDVAAFLMERISAGSSFIVGARPGGAGKTTVMGALLNFIPPDRKIVHTDSPSVLAAAQHVSAPLCIVCHEIGRGSYSGYLWGADAAAFFRLGRYGHTLAANLHADTYEEARRILCRENPVDPEDVAGVDLWLFLSIERRDGTVVRRLNALWVGGRDRVHQNILVEGKFTLPPDCDADRIAACRRLLERMVSRGIFLMEDVRMEILRMWPT